MSVSSTFEVGQIFANRYKLIRPLGKGGMGQVFLAIDQMLGKQELALKILHSELCSDEKHAQRFLREVQLNRQINHNNVVKSFDVGIFGKTLFITMEYVEGKTLKEKLDESKKLDAPEAARIIKEIGIGLAEIHNAQIIHRDLKPGNVIITNQGVVKIGDFGVARPADSDLTAHDEIIGCAPYIAPEVWLGKMVSVQSDLYALGILAYEILTGELPFDGNSPAEVMRKHLDSKPFPINQMLPETPTWLNNLVLKLLEKDPRDRFSSAHQVVNYITKCLANPDVGIVGGTTKSAAVDGSLLEALNRAETNMIEPELNEPLTVPRRTKKKSLIEKLPEQRLPSESHTRSALQVAQLATKRSKKGSGEQPSSFFSIFLSLLARTALIASLVASSWAVNRFCSPILKGWWQLNSQDFWSVLSQIAVAPLNLGTAGLALALPLLSLVIFSPSYRLSVWSLIVAITKAAISAAGLIFLSWGYLLARSAHATSSLSTFSYNSLWQSFEAALQTATPALMLVPKPVAHSFSTEIPLPIILTTELSLLEAAPFYILTGLVLWQSALYIRKTIFKIESIAWYQTVPRVMIVGILLIAVESFFYGSITQIISPQLSGSLYLPIPPSSYSVAKSDLAIGLFNWGMLWLTAAVLPRRMDE